jgi:hypothetical protein
MTKSTPDTWRIFPSRHGILLKSAAGEHEKHEKYLQNGDASCVARAEPPLSLLLSDKELSELTDPRVCAAAHFGPPKQEKESNEDFAIAAIIGIKDGEEYSFAAVADGVSTRTFWSARTARIACLGAYKAVRKCLRGGLDPGSEKNHAEVIAQVAASIDEALANDARLLSTNNSVPTGWDSVVYEKHRGDTAAWYRSTLLFGVLGASGGLIGITGDGGVRALLVENRRSYSPTELRIMFAEAGRDLTSYVGLGFSASDISVIPMRSSERLATHVIFASDGLDLTLQAYYPNEVLNDGRTCHSRYRDLKLDSSASAFELLERLSNKSSTVLDNLSVARLSWPPSKIRRSWCIWKQEDLDCWRLAKDGEQESKSVSSIEKIPAPNWIFPSFVGFILGCTVALTIVFGVIQMNKTGHHFSRLFSLLELENTGAKTKATGLSEQYAPHSSEKRIDDDELDH